MSIDNKAVKAIQEAVDQRIKSSNANRASTHLAEVLNIDAQGTTWVHIFGGAERTPAARTLTHVEKGDLVTVSFEDGVYTVIGSASSPSASQRQVMRVASDAAFAMKDAETAKAAADDALASASTAAQAADEAKASAESAQADAAEAADASDAAQADAVAAGKAANSALNQLGVVQDVVGVLNYVAEHGGFVRTHDQEIAEGKVYFTLDSQTGDYVPVVDPQASALSTYYEVSEDYDDVMGDFIMAHLAVTSRGLWVLPSGVGSSTTPASGESQADSDARQGANYKMLLSSDGTYIYDGNGEMVIKYGQNIEPSEDRQFYIGNEDAYIIFTPASGSTPANITIGGSNINLGDSRTLSELMAYVDRPKFYIVDEYSQDGASVTVTAHVEVNGTDVTSSYPGSCFAWYTKSETGSAPLVPIQSETGYSVTLNRAVVGYGAAVVCRFTEPNDSVLLDDDDDTLTDSQGTPVTGRTPSGDYVRIADLETTTTVFGTDKLLLVGNEDEKLITVSTLKDYLEMTVAKQVEFGTAAYWNARPSLVSESQTLYVYTDHSTDSHGNSIAGIKVGDGSAYLIDLPFTDALETEHRANTDIHVTSEERAFWNNKVRAYYAASEQLVLTTA
jgi:hypothetical protein